MDSSYTDKILLTYKYFSKRRKLVSGLMLFVYYLLIFVRAHYQYHSHNEIRRLCIKHIGAKYRS